MNDPIKSIVIDAQTEELLVAIEMFGDAIITYDLKLWHESLNQPVLELKGNNRNPDDDTLALPTPTLTNKGRYLSCMTFITFNRPSERADATVFMKLYNKNNLEIPLLITTEEYISQQRFHVRGELIIYLD